MASPDNRFCINCGKYSHDIRKCKDPITSVGVILIQFDHKEICEIFQNMIHEKEIRDGSGINIRDLNDVDIFSILQQTIKFMIICRRFTLGFSEFVRGRYSVNNVEEITNLFNQMTQEEINIIAEHKNDLAYLWDIYWLDKGKKIVYDKDFSKSATKFGILTNPDRCEITLDFYIKNAKPMWTHPEWGFPKGRRNRIAIVL